MTISDSAVELELGRVCLAGRRLSMRFKDRETTYMYLKRKAIHTYIICYRSGPDSPTSTQTQIELRSNVERPTDLVRSIVFYWVVWRGSDDTGTALPSSQEMRVCGSGADTSVV